MATRLIRLQCCRACASKGTPRGRVIVAYNGALPDGFEDMLAGAAGTEANREWIKDHYKKIQGSICAELYGPSSFLQRWLRGELSTLSFKLPITNYAVGVRAQGIVPTGETPEAQGVRVATREIYQNALNDLQALWRNTYNEAFSLAIDQATRMAGWERARDMYRNMKDAPPSSDIDVDLLNTCAQCGGTKVVPFFSRPEDQRLAVFQSLCTKDVLASHFETCCLVVDVR